METYGERGSVSEPKRSKKLECLSEGNLVN